MYIEKIPLEDTRQFTNTFIDYVNKNQVFKPFINQFPEPDNFDKVFKTKKFSKERRIKLFEELISQYKDIPASATVLANIKSLVNENCYTVTTGHQLSIFTGPLFFIYKLVTVINTCKILSEKFPDQ